jgi:hypothetical protein
MNKYYFKPNFETVSRIYRENAGHDFEVDKSIFNAILMVEAENEEICENIRGGFTDITQWEMVEPEV